MGDLDSVDDVVRTINDAIYQMADNRFDPNRPFDGQPHTDQGERGKTLVAGLRFRDVCDCFVIGWLQAAGRSALAESLTATYNDIYECDEDIDPLAVMQNMVCEMERRMGIFPNVLRERERPMADQEIPLGLAVILGSLAVHIEEMFDSKDPSTRPFDEAAIRTLLADSELRRWLEKMDKMALLPVKRAAPTTGTSVPTEKA